MRIRLNRSQTNASNTEQGTAAAGQACQKESAGEAENATENFLTDDESDHDGNDGSVDGSGEPPRLQPRDNINEIRQADFKKNKMEGNK